MVRIAAKKRIKVEETTVNHMAKVAKITTTATKAAKGTRTKAMGTKEKGIRTIKARDRERGTEGLG